jgi:hypothetical protein
MASEDGYHREWLGKLPVYGMTPRQCQKWQVLWQLAMPAPAQRPRPEAGPQARRAAALRVIHTFAGAGQIIEDVWDASLSSSPSTSSSPNVVEAEVEEEQEEEEEEGTREVEAEVEAWQMPAIEQACLEFCVELLNQCYHTHEYESALVCAMAV